MAKLPEAELQRRRLKRYVIDLREHGNRRERRAYLKDAEKELRKLEVAAKAAMAARVAATSK